MWAPSRLRALYASARLARALRNISPIVLYHHLAANGDTSFTHNVNPEVFKAQIASLSTRCEFVFCDTLLERIRAGKSIKGLASITFDDATSTAINEGARWLIYKNIPFTVFISKRITRDQNYWRSKLVLICRQHLEVDFITFGGPITARLSADSLYRDSKDPTKANSSDLADCIHRYCELRQVRSRDDFAQERDLVALDTPLVRFGNHSLNHFVLSSLSDDAMRKEIILNQEYLHDTFPTERLSRLFAIPFGGFAAFNSATLECLKYVGCDGFLTSISSMYRTTHKQDLCIDGVVGYNRLLLTNNIRL
jgi:hypothetical protein